MSSVQKPPRARLRHRLGLGAAIIVVLAALAITVGIGVLRGMTTPTQSVAISVDPSSSPSPSTLLFVHVTGAVRVAGLYALPTGARVVDAIAAAGGFSAAARRDGVNLARPVADGEQIVVATKGSATSAASVAPAAANGRIDLNSADAKALDTLPRIGPAMAQRIIDWRQANGRFTSVDDLLAVPGIGDKMLDALRDLVTV